MTITPLLLEAYLKCPTKCWLRFTCEPPTGNRYAEWVRTETESYHTAAAERLMANVPADKPVAICSSRREEAHYSAETLKTAKRQFAVDVPAHIEFGGSQGNEAQNENSKITNPKSEKSQSLLTSAATMETCLHAVERIPSAGRGQPAQFVPIRFIHRNKLTKDDKLLLAFDASMLSEMLGRAVSLGKIIHGDLRDFARSSRGNEAQIEKSEINQSLLTSAATQNGMDEPQTRISATGDKAQPRVTKVKTAALAGEVRKRLGKITALLASAAPPDLVLNRHCAECEFQARCRKFAVEKDDLSLLAGMSAKERQKLRSKGIFTVTQLSYTFRPRRRPKRQRDKREKYHHALKALAIREQKIHIVGSPELKLEGTPVFLDVEGLPDRDFYYLIGVRIGHGDSAVQHSLWADTIADEGKIWREFLALLGAVERPVLIHYGSYETTFLKEMKERHGGPQDESVASNAIASALNIVSVMFAVIYFPTFSNGLKEIATWTGFGWAVEGASGILAIRWRQEWEELQSPQTKAALIAYNTEDCRALERVITMLTTLCNRKANNDKNHNQVVHTDSLPKPTSSWFGTLGKIQFLLPEFEEINRAAYWDYQRERVLFRSTKIPRNPARKRMALKTTPMRANRTVSWPRPGSCPKCNSSLIYKHAPRTKTIIDLKFAKTGVKRWITSHRYYYHRCPACGSVFYDCKNGWNMDTYGADLRAFSVYQAIELGLAQERIAAFFNEVFQIGLLRQTINKFKATAAAFYQETQNKLLQRIVHGGLVHADETQINVDGSHGYVWVFTSFEEVCYLYAESREGDLVTEVLKDFKGVLVSDFYAAYDSLPCPQQKCLIHLTRDLNDELIKTPFDNEMKSIAQEFAALVKSIIETVDRFGLKKRFLQKHKAAVGHFFERLAARDYSSEAATYFKVRFAKNRGKLFTFLDYDNVPWNNNNAEHAIKAFARLRRAIEGLSTPKGIEEYLILLSICQTCKYMGVDFLDFLRSGEKDIHAFAESRHRRKRPAPSSNL